MFSLLYLSVFFLSCSQGFAEDECSPEDCMPGRLCTVATEKIKLTYESKKTDDIERLWEFFSTIQCDGTNKYFITKICCSKMSLLEQFQLEKDSLQQSINAHQNLKLLPKTCGNMLRNRVHYNPAEQNYPWLALLLYENGFECSGSLINERYVLTAAKCVKGKDIERVRLGEYDIRRSEKCRNTEIHGCDLRIEDMLIEETIVHEGFKGDLYDVNDIALIRLKNPANLSQTNIAPICLPIIKDLRKKNMTGTLARVSDWKLGQPYYTYSWEELPIITECKINSGNIICDESNSCEGDLGSPLIVESRSNHKYSYVQYGVISDDYQTCTEEDQRSYCDVTKHMKWILDKIKA